METMALAERALKRAAVGACAALVLAINGPAANAQPLNYSGFASDNWVHYQGDRSSSHYSALAQINRDNVDRLEVAWTYHANETPPGSFSEMQCNPLVVDGVLYGLSADGYVFAVDAATGIERWKFDPFANAGRRRGGRNRGLAYWSDGQEVRLLVAMSSSLYALDPAAAGRGSGMGCAALGWPAPAPVGVGRGGGHGGSRQHRVACLAARAPVAAIRLARALRHG